MTTPSPDQVVSDSIDIAAPPGVVFAILVDPRRHPQIDGSGSVHQTLSGPDTLTQGSRFAMAMRLFGVPYMIRNTVVEYDEDRRIAWRHVAGHRWRYRLEPVDNGTGTRVTESFDYSHYGRLASLVIELAGFPTRNRAGIAGTLVRLKEVAEADARGAA